MAIMGIAKRQLLTAFGNKDTDGLVMVIESPDLNRTELLVWALNEFAGDPDPQHPFHTLIVCKDTNVLDRTRRRLRSVRESQAHTPVTDQKVSMREGTLPKLHEFNYCPAGIARNFAEQFSPGTLNVVVLDQRQGDETDDSDGLADMVEHAQPGFTLVMASRKPAAGNPWERFGEPVILS